MNINVTSIVTGAGFTYFLTALGDVYVVGANSYGQLGVGDYTDRILPVRIPMALNITQIAAGETYVLLLSNSSHVYASGSNFKGELGLGDGNAIATPTQITTIGNAIRVYARFSVSAIITACPYGFSGLFCKEPVCYGMSGNDKQWTCSGQGICVSLDQCQCNGAASGAQCEFQEYHWKGFPGLWSNFQNWYVKKGQTLVSALTVPLLNGDIVYFDYPGSYSITIDVPSSSSSPTIMQTLIIGSNTNAVTISATAKYIDVLASLEIAATSKLLVFDSTFLVPGVATIVGSTTWTNSTIYGNWVVSKQGNMQFAGGSLRFASLVIHGTLNLNGDTTSLLTNTSIVINLGGVVNLDSTSATRSLITSTITINNGGILNIVGATPIGFFAGALRINMGGTLNIQGPISFTGNSNLNINIGGVVYHM